MLCLPGLASSAQTISVMDRLVPLSSLVTFFSASDHGEYKWMMIITFATVALLLLMLIILSLSMKRRMKAEKALSEERQQLLSLLDSIADAVIATDAQGKVIRMNMVAEQLTGWTLEQARGLDLTEVFKIIDIEDRTPIQSPATRILNDQQAANIHNALLLTRDGRELEIADSGSPIRNYLGDPVGVVLVFRDITEKRMLENQLLQAQKMEAIGQLAGGIAHDFNNLLGGIIGYADLLKFRMKEQNPLINFVDLILETSQRAADLTAQLLAFSRRCEFQSVSVDLHELIEEVAGLLEHTIDKRIEIKLALNASNHTVIGDPTQLQNALLNLAVNSRDAMPQGGHLTFATRELSSNSTNSSRAVRRLKPGPHIEISIRDTGMGMAKNVQEHIFEPFYTTKEPGKGTGLGLAAVYGTVQAHAGDISLRSQPDGGTTFTLLLPLASPEQQQDAIENKKSEEVIHGQGLVLVVEDDQVILEMAQEMLLRIGYQVLSAQDGMQAIQVYESKHSDIDLVILDMVMPKMNGPQTLAELRKIEPQVAVLIISGLDVGPGQQQTLDKKVKGFIQKPFNLAVLSQKVAQAIEDS